MPSATDYKRAAEEAAREAGIASARAAELRELAATIRSAAAPLTTSYDSLHARHLAGIWLSEAAHRSRVAVAEQRARCRDAAETSQALAAALEQRAAGFDADARTAARRAERAAETEASNSEASTAGARAGLGT